MMIYLTFISGLHILYILESLSFLELFFFYFKVIFY